ncbi:ribose 5-phosphate isomerase B [Candidatus Spyradosoma sp. SGI.093]|uniref:ribose 5-phosphate isomerase B n=1 Tax=Candidatus Spyradosoma sp. SGI.093 TaxID=3420583 RepID=UPI003D006F0B
MKISIGSDHAGFELKQELAEYLRSRGHEVADYGAASKDSVDYPLFAHAVARDVASGAADRGVLVCWTGVGISIAANKVAGVRAGNCFNVEMAGLFRRHNDGNVICFGQKFIAPADAKAMLDAFLATDFEGGRHARRVGEIEDLAACACRL